MSLVGAPARPVEEFWPGGPLSEWMGAMGSDEKNQIRVCMFFCGLCVAAAVVSAILGLWFDLAIFAAATGWFWGWQRKI